MNMVNQFLKVSKILWLILLFSLLTRLYRINIPETYYFDEVYHAFTAKSYANNDPRGYEWWHTSPEKGTAYEWLHPPVSKLIMAGSMKLLGQNSFGWRLPSAIFGTLVIYLIFVLARDITKKKFKKQSKNIGLLAAFLASLDGLLLVQSRIAMNDIFLTTFLLLSVIFYWRWCEVKKNEKQKTKNKQLLLAGIFLGLSVASKWSGVFILGIFGTMELVLLTKNWKKWQKRIKGLVFSLIVVPVVVYILSYSQFWLQGHSWEQFTELHNQIIRYELGLEATHSYQSPAWQWPLLIRPVWYQVDYSIEGLVGNVYALSNPIISWGGLVAVFWLLSEVIRKRNWKREGIYLLIAYFMVWLPWVLAPRIMFYYHYTPAIPFLTTVLAIGLTALWRKGEVEKMVSVSVIILAVLSFIFLLPLWVGTPVLKELTKYFFWLPSWK